MIFSVEKIIENLTDIYGAKKVFSAQEPYEGYNLVDKKYHGLTEDWILTCWDAWVSCLPDELRKIKRGVKGFRVYPRWISGCYDCDNASHDFQAFCSRQNAIESVNSNVNRYGIGVFCINYKAEPKRHNLREGGHCINLILIDDALVPFEPAEGVVTTLTNTEWGSIWFIDGF